MHPSSFVIAGLGLASMAGMKGRHAKKSFCSVGKFPNTSSTCHYSSDHLQQQ